MTRYAPPADVTAFPVMFTTEEVAALFRVDVKTVSRWARQGRLGRVCRPGAKYLFPEPNVAHAVAGGTFDTNGDPILFDSEGDPIND